jgi:hypothetical protein
MGSLLTFPAPAFPFVCAENELAVLVLLAVSACNVVFVAGIVLGDAGLLEPPHDARQHDRQSDPSKFKP